MGGLCVGSDPTPKVEAKLQTQGRCSHRTSPRQHMGPDLPQLHISLLGHHMEESLVSGGPSGELTAPGGCFTSMLCILRTDQVRGCPHLWPLPSEATGLSSTGTKSGCRSYWVGAFPAPAPRPPWGPYSKWVRAPHTPLTRPEH